MEPSHPGGSLVPRGRQRRSWRAVPPRGGIWTPPEAQRGSWGFLGRLRWADLRQDGSGGVSPRDSHGPTRMISTPGTSRGTREDNRIPATQESHPTQRTGLEPGRLRMERPIRGEGRRHTETNDMKPSPRAFLGLLTSREATRQKGATR